jgi:pyruvate carboxylase
MNAEINDDGDGGGNMGSDNCITIILELPSLPSYNTPNLPPPVTRQKCLIANRGEIAIRIANAAAVCGLESVAVYHSSDSACLHVSSTTEAREIVAKSSPLDAYLDSAQMIQVAKTFGCDCIHPGYGFLSENAAFADACQSAGIKFVGPPASAIGLFGDKVQARTLAESLGIPVIPGSPVALGDSQEAVRLVQTRADIGYPVMLKASAGGGGRGMRVVERASHMPSAFDTCSREAKAAFGDGSIFVERLLIRPRHVEVQILADSHGNMVHLHDRDCSVQLRNQKVVEVAPAPNLDPSLRARMHSDAIKLCRAANYVNAGTVEFLVAPGRGGQQEHFFIEVNPRIQVEHTVTEQVVGVDLVALQFQIAAGASLASLGLGPSQDSVPIPRGFAVQARVVARGPGTILAYKEPSGAGVRVDALGYTGLTPPGQYDPLLAKVVAFSNDNLLAAVARAVRALQEFHLVGLPTNIHELQAILSSIDFVDGEGVYHATTAFLGDHPEITAGTDANSTRKGLLALLEGGDAGRGRPGAATTTIASLVSLHSRPAPPNHAWVVSPLQGSVAAVEVQVNDVIAVDATPVVVLLSMKMEHHVTWDGSGGSGDSTDTANATRRGKVVEVLVRDTELVEAGQPVALV